MVIPAALVATAAGAATLLVATSYSRVAVVYAGAGAVAAFAISVLAVIGVRRLLGLGGGLRWGAALGCTVVLAPLLVIGTINLLDVFGHRDVTATPPRIVGLLGSHSHELTGVYVTDEREDLEPFRTVWESRRVVALGEASHGTSEFFLLKHRLVRYLVEELGFRHFAMETPPRVAEVLDRFIQGGDAAPERVLYWPWATAEYMRLLEWMREYNAGAPAGERIRFHGIDPQEGDRDQAMASNTLAILEREGPEAKVIIWAANSHVRAAMGGMGEYLRQHLGDDLYLLGLEFHQGWFTSRTRQIHVFRAGPFPHTYYSHAFARLPGPARFLDFGQAGSSEALQKWLREPRTTNHLFEMYALTRLIRPFPRVRQPLPALFDGMVFVRESTPPTLLRAAAGIPGVELSGPGRETALLDQQAWSKEEVL